MKYIRKFYVLVQIYWVLELDETFTGVRFQLILVPLNFTFNTN